MHAVATATASPPISTSFRIESGSIWRRIFGIDLRSLAVLRIGIGMLLLVDLYQRSGDLRVFYSDYGAMPRTLLTNGVLDSPWCLSLYLIGGAVPVMAVLFGLAAICALCLIIGFRTRLATIASWVLLLSLHYRNPMVLQGGDVLLRMILFFGIFLPLGACWSVDQRTRRGSFNRAGLFFSVATVALLLQIVFMYEFSILLKTDPVWWRDFTAVYDALSLSHFARPLGIWLLPHIRLLKYLTIATLAVESLGPPLALIAGLCRWPARLAVITIVIAFHAVMGVCMQLGLFSYICATAWVAFLPGDFWNCIEMAWRRRAGGAARRIWSTVTAPLSQLAGFLPQWLARSPWATFSLRPNVFTRTTVLFFLIYVFLWNVRSLNFNPYTQVLPASMNWIGWMTGTAQVWDMFSPAPLREGGWFIMPAQLADGSQVDLWRKGAPVTWNRPRLISAMYRNDRWRKYMVLFAESANSNKRLPFAQWLAAQWNENHPPPKQVLTFQIYLMLQRTLPNNVIDRPHPLLLWMQDCREN